MATTVTLTASAKYGYGGKQYIARITGRHPKWTFERTFIDRKSGKRREDSEAMVDECGLYVECDIDRRGNKGETYYYVVPARNGDGIVIATIAREDAMVIAKELDAGHSITECPSLVSIRQAAWAKMDRDAAEKAAAEQAAQLAAVDFDPLALGM